MNVYSFILCPEQGYEQVVYIRAKTYPEAIKIRKEAIAFAKVQESSTRIVRKLEYLGKEKDLEPEELALFNGDVAFFEAEATR